MRALKSRGTGWKFSAFPDDMATAYLILRLELKTKPKEELLARKQVSRKNRFKLNFTSECQTTAVLYTLGDYCFSHITANQQHKSVTFLGLTA